MPSLRLFGRTFGLSQDDVVLFFVPSWLFHFAWIVGMSAIIQAIYQRCLHILHHSGAH